MHDNDDVHEPELGHLLDGAAAPASAEVLQAIVARGRRGRERALAGALVLTLIGGPLAGFAVEHRRTFVTKRTGNQALTSDPHRVILVADDGVGRVTFGLLATDSGCGSLGKGFPGDSSCC